MGESFFGLNVAVRGLYAAQRNLDVVNHNVNNTNTEGYSRQVAVQKAARPMAVYDGTGMVGTGANVTSVERIRDEYLDFKYWSEQTTKGEWAAKQEVLSDLEVSFNEPSDSGFTTIMDDFYSSMQELAKDPSSSACRALVKQKAVTLCKYFNSMATHLEDLQSDVNNRVKTKVEEINSYATQISQLNRQIYMTELDGSNANDLRDQRTVLVDKLSGLVNVDANEVVAGRLPNGDPDKHFVITISGKTLVDHFKVSEVAVVQRQQKVNEEEDIPNLYQVQWKDGNELNVKGGELKGYLDVRDGNEAEGGDNPNYKGIPFYIKKLNQFVQTFAMNFNEGFTNITRDASGNVTGVDSTTASGHVDGQGLKSTTTTPTAPTRFFTTANTDGVSQYSSDFIGTIPTSPPASAATVDSYIVGQYTGQLTAKNIAVSLDIIDDPNLIATSDAAGEVGNIEILNQLLDFREDTKMFAEGKPEDFMKSLVATLGIDSQQSVTLSDIQDTIVKQLDNRRLAESGVSLNEEMANLVKFQQAYNSAAKMITTMSEIYDTLINKLGVS
jgi:flagellar hook-associated protein 1 FlgK